MRTLLKTTLLAFTTLAFVPAARAHDFTGDHELGVMLGGQVGVHEAPGGGKLLTEYGQRLSSLTWLNLQMNLAFGDGGTCYLNRRTGFVECGNFSGQALEMIAGAKFKFRTRHEQLVPYAKAGAGLALLYFPGADNDGVAPVVRGGGGLKYYIVPNLAVGGEMDMAFGPGFIGCGPGCTMTASYVSADLAGGFEINF